MAKTATSRRLQAGIVADDRGNSISTSAWSDLGRHWWTQCRWIGTGWTGGVGGEGGIEPLSYDDGVNEKPLPPDGGLTTNCVIGYCTVETDGVPDFLRDALASAALVVQSGAYRTRLSRGPRAPFQTDLDSLSSPVVEIDRSLRRAMPDSVTHLVPLQALSTRTKLWFRVRGHCCCGGWGYGGWHRESLRMRWVWGLTDRVVGSSVRRHAGIPVHALGASGMSQERGEARAVSAPERRRAQRRDAGRGPALMQACRRRPVSPRRLTTSRRAPRRWPPRLHRYPPPR